MKTVARRVRENIKALFIRGDYEPRWEGPVVKYAALYLGRHAWRVDSVIDLDDLLQDAYILFLKLRERYDVENPQHFMALWKVTLRNWIGNLARSRSRRPEVPMANLSLEEKREARRKMISPQRQGEKKWLEWLWHCQEQPVAVGRLSRSAERSGPRRRMKRSTAGRETTNQYLCRMAEVPGSVPLRHLLETWLHDGS